MTDKNSVLQGHRAAVRFLLAVVALLSSLALSVSAKTTIDFDPNIDFSRFKTFAYIGGVENLVMMQLNPDLINTRIHRMVVRELEKKGLREVNADQNPDVVVRYWANSETRVDVAVMGNWGVYGPFIGSYWGYLYNTVTATNQRQGTLILDLIDPRTKALAWRLYLVRKITDPDKDWKKADEEFTEGFKSFPPTDKDKEEKRKEREKQDQSKKPS
jgi:hypothetical protein